MNKVELNNDYINTIMLDKSDILKVRYQEKLEDGSLHIVIEDQVHEFFEGIVKKTENGDYIIVGDNEFNRVYPIFDTKAKKIVKIKRSEEFPPG
jgi:Ni,Fe-hydrogenase I small subunit